MRARPAMSRVVRETRRRRTVVSSCANCRKVLVAAGIED